MTTQNYGTVPSRKMIIKFKSGKRWVVFGEIDHLEYEELSKEPGGADSTIGGHYG